MVLYKSQMLEAMDMMQRAILECLGTLHALRLYKQTGV